MPVSLPCAVAIVSSTLLLGTGPAPTWTTSLPPADLFWSADHEVGAPGETGGLSQWFDVDAEFPGGGIFNTGAPPEAEAVIDPSFAHSGNYGVRMSIIIANPGESRAVRLMRWRDMGWDQGASQPLPAVAFYSAWYYFPEVFDPPVWWNIFQFKAKSFCGQNGSDPIFSMNVYNDSATNDMSLYFWSGVNDPSSIGQLHDPPLTLPVGRWVHIETRYEVSPTPDGRVTVWQDGEMIIDVDNVITELGCPETTVWGIGNYTDDIAPAAATIYTDDAVISHARAWTLSRPGDVDFDGRVDFADLLEVIGNWGPCAPSPAACLGDATGDRTVNFADILGVIEHWD